MRGGKRILIVGCGELGSRHLQAVAKMDSVAEVEVVDPSSDSLALGQKRLRELGDRNLEIEYRWLRSLDEASHGGDACILAVCADARLSLFEEILLRLGYKTFILEKVVAQKVEDYEQMLRLEEEYGASVWVNCLWRTYENHRHIKSRLIRGETFSVSVTGGNRGLATLGIHAADLFSYYEGGSEILRVSASVEPVLMRTKRKNHFDFSGTLQGKTSGGGKFFLSFLSEGEVLNNTAPLQIVLNAPGYRAVADDIEGSCWESTLEKGWEWEKVDYQKDIYVSSTTRIFLNDIFRRRRCALPTLRESFPAHQFILESLLPEFQKQMGKEWTRCPVT